MPKTSWWRGYFHFLPSGSQKRSARVRSPVPRGEIDAHMREIHAFLLPECKGVPRHRSKLRWHD